MRCLPRIGARGFHFRFPALQFGQADRTMLMEIFRPLKGQLRFVLPRRRLEVRSFGHPEIGTVEQRQPLTLLHILPHIDQHLDDSPSNKGRDLCQFILVGLHGRGKFAMEGKRLFLDRHHLDAGPGNFRIGQLHHPVGGSVHRLAGRRRHGRIPIAGCCRYQYQPDHQASSRKRTPVTGSPMLSL